jgi:hypothetical protein
MKIAAKLVRYKKDIININNKLNKIARLNNFIQLSSLFLWNNILKYNYLMKVTHTHTQ